LTDYVLETASFPQFRARLRRLARALADRDFRHAFMGRQLRAFLAQQIRALRGEQSQKEFGELIGKPQSVVSRLEKQADKNISIQTLIDIAAKLDVAVIIRFVDFPTFFRYTSDNTEAALAPASYNQDVIDRLAAVSTVPDATVIHQDFIRFARVPLGPKPSTGAESIQQNTPRIEDVPLPHSNVVELRPIQQRRSA
jgi:transcriptional regulator with XRE-family HTH domain